MQNQKKNTSSENNVIGINYASCPGEFWMLQRH